MKSACLKIEEFHKQILALKKAKNAKCVKRALQFIRFA